MLLVLTAPIALDDRLFGGLPGHSCASSSRYRVCFEVRVAFFAQLSGFGWRAWFFNVTGTFSMGWSWNSPLQGRFWLRRTGFYGGSGAFDGVESGSMGVAGRSTGADGGLWR